MSRCFPFPPPGYAGKCASNDALIVSIKLQRERENSISDRDQQLKVKSSDKKKVRGVEKIKSSDNKKKKDRKREKNEKKDKHKVLSAVDSEKQKHIEKLYKGSGACSLDSKSKQILQKPEQLLEQSNLTEEHCRPVESQNVSCSSDSTGNSGKRKINSSSPNSVQANKIRIRLSSQKKDDPSIGSTLHMGEDHCSLQSNVGSCSTLVTESSIGQKLEMSAIHEPNRTPSLSTATLQLLRREGKEAHATQQRETISVPPLEVPLISGKNELKQSSRKLSSHERRMLKKESLYNSLFQKLLPPSLPNDQVDLDEDEEWLFSKKDAERPTKRLRGSDELVAPVHNVSCSTSAVLQPRAHYLADVGVYALPFAVPF